jgi:hypothetical protein
MINDVQCQPGMADPSLCTHTYTSHWLTGWADRDDTLLDTLDLVLIADIDGLTNHVRSIFNALKAAPVTLDVPLIRKHMVWIRVKGGRVRPCMVFKCLCGGCINYN